MTRIRVCATVASLALMDPAAALNANPGDHPCEALPAALEPLHTAWTRPPVTIDALRQPGPGAQLLAGVRTRIALAPAESVAPLVHGRPESFRPGSHAGIIAFDPPRDGFFRVATSERVWIELVSDSSGKPAVAATSDKRANCNGIVKNLAFYLTGGSRYWLQFSGVAHPRIDVLVVSAEE